MVAQQDPIAIPFSHLAAVQALDPADRTLLAFFLTAGGTLTDIAAQCRLDIVTLTERILAPDMQAALHAIEHAAAQLCRVRALIGRPIAIAALAEVSTDTNPDPIERRRAAAALLKAAPAATRESNGVPPSAAQEGGPRVVTGDPAEADSATEAPPEPSETAATSQSASSEPLTPHELAALADLLPHVRPERFTRKHTPAYWREVLARHAPHPRIRAGPLTAAA